MLEIGPFRRHAVVNRLGDICKAKSDHLGVLAFALAYWLVCFFPYDWSPPVIYYPNHAEMLAGGERAFAAPGIARLSVVPPWLGRIRDNHAFRLEMRVTSLATYQYGPARILTLSRDTQNRNLTVAQDGDDLSLRLRSAATGENGTPDYFVRRVFEQGEPVQLRIELDQRQLVVAVDSEVKLRRELPAEPLATWDDSFSLALGNELTLDRPWLGVIHEAHLSSRGESLFELSDPMVMESSWLVSKRFADMDRENLIPFARWRKPRMWWDALLNILGFVPMGFAYAWGRGCHALLARTSMLAAGLSLSIEVGQVFFDGRTPSSTDVVTNTLGGVIGVYLARRAAISRPSLSRLSSRFPRPPR